MQILGKEFLPPLLILIVDFSEVLSNPAIYKLIVVDQVKYFHEVVDSVHKVCS